MSEIQSAKPFEGSIPTILGLAKLLKLGFDEVNLAPLWKQLADRFVRDNADVSPLMDLCILDQLLGLPERGLGFQSQALQDCRLFQVKPDRLPANLRVLGFTAPGVFGNNTPIEFLIEDCGITLFLIYVVPGEPLPPIPEHDVVFVVAGECEENRAALHELERLLTKWPHPVLNAPSLVPQIGRERFFKLMQSIAGVVAPATIRIDRNSMQRIGRGEMPVERVLPDGGFPIIARPVDSHAGHGLEMLTKAAEVGAYLRAHLEPEFYLSRYIDYRDPDGFFRKYRVVIIDGEAFPCHMGVSDHWMIHYVNAGMLESAGKRAEEQCFMDRFTLEFGLRHKRALVDVARVLGLDYFGIDCAETPEGNLLIFEADTAMIVHNMDPETIFPYKSRHMRLLFTAFQTMLKRRSDGRRSFERSADDPVKHLDHHFTPSEIAGGR